MGTGRAPDRASPEVSFIGADEEPFDPSTEDEGVARTQTYAAIIIVVLVVATVAVALTIERPETEVKRSDWAYDMTQLESAWEAGMRGQGVRVGIVDTGIDADHPVLKDASVVAWLDLVNDRQEPYDDVGHGTAMASIIAGHSPLRGGAVDVELIIVKVLDHAQGFSDTIVADGIDFCMDPDGDGDYSDGADIISLSLGGEYDNIDILLGTKTEAAIAQAISHGIVCVAAAGNDGSADDVSMPSRIPEVISVGALDRWGQMAPFSSPGNTSEPRLDPDKKLEVVAPGVDIVTAYNDGLHAKGSGTSHATAFTTAVLAVALAAAPDLKHDGAEGGNVTSVKRVKTALMETAKPLEGQISPHDPKSGYGLIQAVDLIVALKA
ncbi:MAG: S8 family serine peptidase [Thermoplasmata archaeon]|nr:S8 family serine peptidase [Thermoplasmata archaeon]